MLTLTVVIVAAITVPTRWTTLGGFFAAPDPSTEEVAACVLVVSGLSIIGLSLLLECGCVVGSRLPTRLLVCLRVLTVLAALVGFAGCNLSFAHLLAKGGKNTMVGGAGIAAAVSFPLIATLASALGLFCDSCWTGLTLCLRGRPTSQERTDYTRTQIQGMGIRFRQRFRQARNVLRRQVTDPDIALELEETSNNLSVPIEIIRKVKSERPKVSTGFPEGSKPFVHGGAGDSEEDSDRTGHPQHDHITEGKSKRSVGVNVEFIEEDVGAGQASVDTATAKPPASRPSGASEKPAEAGASAWGSQCTEPAVQAVPVRVPSAEEETRKTVEVSVKGVHGKRLNVSETDPNVANGSVVSDTGSTSLSCVNQTTALIADHPRSSTVQPQESDVCLECEVEPERHQYKGQLEKSLKLQRTRQMAKKL
ncbi:hypothetical protein ACOMHN_046351 [Nucella lapillus]